VPPLPVTTIRKALLDRENINPELVDDATRRANGNFSTAVALIESEQQELQHLEWFSTLMRHAFQRKIEEISAMVDQLATIGRERQKQFLQYTLRLVRENFMLTLKKEELSFMSAQEDEFARKFHVFIHQGNVFELVEQLTLAHNHIEANGNPRLVFMDLSIKIIILLKAEKVF
jgi:DNA polymerase-3 subunit delta'